ncbi:hypothetical protein AArcCO_2413 [Halalkaliarchaeum sp. AArc-CO]|nr:hypothetical protein AArcCO_2413 [Halalkaliarchaeum sp. AArc-CO]
MSYRVVPGTHPRSRLLFVISEQPIKTGYTGETLFHFRWNTFAMHERSVFAEVSVSGPVRL